MRIKGRERLRDGGIARATPDTTEEQAGELLRARLLKHLEDIDIFTVNSDLSRLISSAANKLGPEPLREDDPFCTKGFVYMEAPYHIPREDLVKPPPFESYIPAWSWEARELVFGVKGSNIDYRQGVALNTYARIYGVTLWLDGGAWSFEESWHVGQEDINGSRAVLPERAHQRRWLLAFWRLVKQRIILPATVQAPRHVRRATKKKRHEIKTLKIIKLRATERKAGSHDDDHAIVDWSHRWCVEGHWRNQWYPTKQRHEQIYIHPYIKGPDDKPLVLKEKIFDVSR